jgi:GR25 family glycosyltransferase involved in LPS biosynthesis
MNYNCPNYDVYCLSLNNEERKQNMKRRFDQIGIDCKVYEGVTFENLRIYDKNIDDKTKRVWSCMYGHLDMINEFYYNSEKEYGIFCEDDLYIHKSFKELLPKIILDFKILKLDVLLLSYLLPIKPEHYPDTFPIKYGSVTKIPFTFHEYPEDTWGAQMYMMNKSYAKYLLDKYYHNYADSTISNPDLIPFSSDWIITKDTKQRALLSPLLAVEDGNFHYSDKSQAKFHADCYHIHFDTNIFIT